MMRSDVRVVVGIPALMSRNLFKGAGGFAFTAVQLQVATSAKEREMVIARFLPARFDNK